MFIFHGEQIFGKYNQQMIFCFRLFKNMWSVGGRAITAGLLSANIFVRG